MNYIASTIRFSPPVLHVAKKKAKFVSKSLNMYLSDLVIQDNKKETDTTRHSSAIGSLRLGSNRHNVKELIRQGYLKHADKIFRNR